MSSEASRTLTTLEYVVLGLIGTEPQSGYSLITFFESGVYRWSASPGSIYPMLKRLEQQGIIAGRLEMEYETRPRKMYTLTPLGESLLDDWLRAPLANTEIGQERDIVLLKFLFSEKRLTRDEVLAWLDGYEKATETYIAMSNMQRDPNAKEWSVHQQLVIEASFMELEMQRTWIRQARQRLTGDRRQ
jgi:DNA-binding PadR family transcriptional regulator